MNSQQNGTTVDYYSDNDEWVGSYFQNFNGAWNAYYPGDHEGKYFGTEKEAEEFLLVQIVKQRMKS